MTDQKKSVQPNNIDTNSAIWIVAACLTYSKCYRKSKFTIEDVGLDDPSLLDALAAFLGRPVEVWELDQVTRGKNENHINYLVESKNLRRLSYMDESHCIHECPSLEELKQLQTVKIKGKSYQLLVVFDYINKTYTRAVKKMTATTIKVKPKEASEKMSRSHKEKTTTTYDKNMILYGPPGTGKTYSTAIYAVAICDQVPLELLKEMTYQEVMERYEELRKEKRIEFTTFHQSYGYEEFIEGIKPVVDEEDTGLTYEIAPGIFKKFCKMANVPAKSKIKVNPNANIWFVRLDYKKDSSKKKESFEKGILQFYRKEGNLWCEEHFVNSMQLGDYVISYAGKSEFIDAIGVIESECEIEEQNNGRTWTRKVNWYQLDQKENVYAINSETYLPNFEFARMNHMQVNDLLSLVSDEKDMTSQTRQPYVFVIDEINRGNISKIFGELITLIEETKRQGMPEQASAKLPYSGENFSVPANVYLIGTMNTADRSIALMDTALRRRFQFVEMMPDADVLRNIGADKVEDLDVAWMLETINERITYLYDREHTIGHAFFTKLAADPTIETLASIFQKSVIPLLQEYFYEDYDKIQLVLGDNGKKDEATKFILDKHIKVTEIFKGRVSDTVDIPEKKYEINKDAFMNIESYKQIM